MWEGVEEGILRKSKIWRKKNFELHPLVPLYLIENPTFLLG